MRLSFRGKTIFILGLTLLTLTLVLYAVSELTLRARFSALERADAQEDVQRVQSAIGADLDALAAGVADWAAWDQLLAFAGGDPAAAPDSQTIDATLRNLHLNLLVVTDRDGDILLARGYDLAESRETAVSPALIGSLRRDGSVAGLGGRSERYKTIVQTDAAPMLVASAPILSNAGEGPSAGTLLMGRYLDEILVARMQSVTGLSASVFPLDGAAQSDDVRTATARLMAGESAWVDATAADTVASYALLRNPSGSAAAVIEVEQARDIAAMASQTTSFFLLALLIVSAIVGGLGLFVTERLVFARVGRLVGEIVDLGKSAEPGARLQEGERGRELPGLTRAINGMLEALDESRGRLDEERRQLEHILATIGVGIVLVDEADGRIVSVNPVGLSILGRSDDDVIGFATSELFEPVASEASSTDEALEIENDEWLVRRSDGSTVPVLLTVVPIRLGGRPCLLQSFMDISERKRDEQRIREEVERRRQREAELVGLQERLEAANAKLQDLSLLDGLTGIGNRRRFDRRLDAEWARAARDAEPLSLIMVDIDFFKAYNDTYGHVAGDRCLQEVASALARAVRRPGDLVARYGGEEFAAILPNTTLPGALEVAERLRHDLRGLRIPHRASAAGPHLTVSIGVAATLPTIEASAYSLVRAADAALYEAKARGRDRVETTSLVPETGFEAAPAATGGAAAVSN